MQARTVFILATIAVLAAIGAALLDGRKAASPAAIDVRLYPALSGSLNESTSIALSGSDGSRAVTIERKDTGWIVAQENGYRADSGKIRQLLLRLSDAVIVETKTSNPDLYARLGVAEPGSAEGAGTLLEIGEPADVRLIVGKRESRAGKGTYARRAEEETSYLVDADIELETDPLNWLDRQLFDIDSQSVLRVEIHHESGEEVVLQRVGEQLVILGIPEGRSLSSPGAAQPVSRALSSLLFDDVLPRAEFEDFDPQATVRFHLDDGRRITVHAQQRDDERWVSVQVALEPVESSAGLEPVAAAADPENDEPDTAGGETASAEPLPDRLDAEEVARQDARFSGWIYRLPVYKYEQIVRRMEDFLLPAAE
jgi:hypothetical protein